MCKNLGFKLTCTSNPQNKGKVERLFKTLQDRLIAELRRNNISTKKEANNFLERFLQEFNKKFASYNKNIPSVFDNQLTKEEIFNNLSVISRRKIDKGHSIKYNNKYYVPLKNNNEKILFKKETTCFDIKRLDDSLLVNIEDKLYHLTEISQNELVSEEFNIVIKPKVKFIPPSSHPWETKSSNVYLKKIKHQNAENSGAEIS